MTELQQRFFSIESVAQETSGTDGQTSLDQIRHTLDELHAKKTEDPLKAISPAEIFFDGSYDKNPDDKQENKNVVAAAREKFYSMAERLNVRLKDEVREIIDNDDTHPQVIFFLVVLMSRNLRAREENRRKREEARAAKKVGDDRADRMRTIDVSSVDRRLVDRAFKDIGLLLRYWNVPEQFYSVVPSEESPTLDVLMARESIEAYLNVWHEDKEMSVVQLKHLLADLCSILDYLARIVMMASQEYQTSDEVRQKELLLMCGYNRTFLSQLESAGADVSDLESHQHIFTTLKFPRNYSTHHGLHLLLDTDDDADSKEQEQFQEYFFSSAANITGSIERVCAVVQRCHNLFYN